MSKVGPLYDWTSAIADSDLAATSRHVALTFALHLNRRDRSAYPGAAKLAEETGLHLSTVKRALADLEARGWLVCEQRGGSIKGGKRLATVWACAIPEDPTGRTEDPVHPATGGPGRADRYSCARGPVAQDDPNYPENYPRTPPGDDDLRPPAPEALTAAVDDDLDVPPAQRGTPAPTGSVSELVAGWIADSQAVLGRRPPRSWCSAAGAAVKRALADGATPADIALALGDRAARNQHPNTLTHALCDLYAERAAQ